MRKFEVRRSMCAITLLLLASLASGSATACSCVASKEKASEVREWIGQMFEGSRNVVLLRAVSVTEVGKDHERAVLRVVESWQGVYKPGSLVQSDTPEIGWGMCHMSIDVGQEILVAFTEDPILISGCPSSFVLTRMERRYLNLLAPKAKEQKAKRTVNNESIAPKTRSGMCV